MAHPSPRVSTDHNDFKSRESHPHSVLVVQLPHSERRQLAQLPTLPDFDVLFENFHIAVERSREEMASGNQLQGPKVDHEGDVHPSHLHLQSIGRPLDFKPPSLEFQLQDFLANACTERNETGLRLAAQSIIRAPTLVDIEDIISQFDNLTTPVDTLAKGCLSIRYQNEVPFRVSPAGTPYRTENPFQVSTASTPYRNEVLLQVPPATPYRNEVPLQVPPVILSQQGNRDESPDYTPTVIQSSHKNTTVTTSEPPLLISSISTFNPGPSSTSKKNSNQTSSKTDKSKVLNYIFVKDRLAQINETRVRFKWWIHEGSEEKIKSPTVTPENEKIETGDLFFYRTVTHKITPLDYQAWMFTTNGGWVDITSFWQSDDGSLRHPLDRSRILTTRTDGTPTYVAESTWKDKAREKKRVSASVAAGISSQFQKGKFIQL